MHLRKKSSENVLKNEDIKAWESHESVGIFNKQLNKWKWMSSATFTTTIAKLPNSRLKLGKFSGRIYSCTRIEIVFQPVFEKCGKYILLSNYIHSESYGLMVLWSDKLFATERIIQFINSCIKKPSWSSGRKIGSHFINFESPVLG